MTNRLRKKKKNSIQFKLYKQLLAFLIVIIASGAVWIGDSFESQRLPSSGKPAELYTNQGHDDLTSAITGAINRAQKSVLLIVYALTDTTVIDCLKSKSKQGIDIRVVCDAKASPYIDSKLGPNIATTRRFGPGLMHQKILVVDGQETWIGSANMTTESLKMHGNLITAMQSAEIAEHIMAKASTMDVEGQGRAFAHRVFDIGGQNIELWFLPDDKKAVGKIKSLLQSAKKTVRVAMFTWTRYDLAYAVIAAHKRGVDVEVVIDSNSGKGASAKVAALLKDNDVKIAFNRGNALLHHKFLYIDEKILVNGSANWTKAAFTQNDDCFIVIPELNEAQHQCMESLWQVISNEGSRL